MVDLAAIGLVNGAWLNTCVENWHAEGRIHDGDMLRVNSHTTWRVRQLMHRWLRETGLNAAEERGALFGFARTAAHGGMACSHWWGHPRWPTQVDRFMKALGDPADDHWGPAGKYRAELPAEPVDVADRARLRHLLLSQPWDLSTDAAQWLVDAGIRYVSAEHGSFAV